MSKFSGKCDLYDHVFMIGCKGTADEMSELEKFEIFKQRTSGLLHQSRKLYLEKWNVDYEIEYRNNPAILRKEKVNGRTKYFYYGKAYSSLKALNKVGYYTDFLIYFDTILDLVPYYPYIIAICASDQEGEYIEITKHSHVEDELMEPWRKIKYGKDSIHSYYKEQLNKELIRIVKEYY